MFEVAGELEPVINIIFLAATGYIAWRGIRYRTPEGDSDIVHLLFGCIAALFFVVVLTQDVLGLRLFY